MADEDKKHVAAVRRLACCMCGKPGPGEAHHHSLAGAGMGKRAHDHLAMPLCSRCHHDLHALCGPFKGCSRAMLREWQDKQVGLTWRLIRGTFDGCPLPEPVSVYSNNLPASAESADCIRTRLGLVVEKLMRGDDDETF